MYSALVGSSYHAFRVDTAGSATLILQTKRAGQNDPGYGISAAAGNNLAVFSVL